VIVIQEPFGQSWDGIRPTVLAERAGCVVVAAGIVVVVVGHGGGMVEKSRTGSFGK